ncbi:hypothetical protein BDW59DRAFT_154348 [Aspergillus cavernicola]|uniref:Uncharacterized protein n=1 Tax=Aspergillus cavernicola TaxID=176166 RepID=A0ABR4HHC1_9EURO
MPFQTTIPKPALLIPSKRPLSQPSPQNPTPSSGSASSQPTLIIRSAQAQTHTKPDKSKEIQRIEVDFSAAPQQFLDPGVWERMCRSLESGNDRVR